VAEDLGLESSTVAASVEQIRAELARGKLATSTVNLLVWIDDPARRAWIRERVGLLTEKYPSFTLILDHTGVQQQATVTTSARNANVTVGAERVEIDVSGEDAQAVAAYVSGLCTRGVPTVLWWSGFQESSRPIFAAILPMIDTLVVDSSGGTRDQSALRALASFHAEHPEVTLRDLAWLRLLPWRDIIAYFFDDAKATSELASIRRLAIASGSESEALYLAGWMASALGWRASGKNAFTAIDGNTIAFERRQTGDIRRVQSICLDSDTSWYHAEVAEDADNVVRVWVEGELGTEPRLVPLQAIDNASLLERSILEPGVDELFETALRSAATLLG